MGSLLKKKKKTLMAEALKYLENVGRGPQFYRDEIAHNHDIIVCCVIATHLNFIFI